MKPRPPLLRALSILLASPLAFLGVSSGARAQLFWKSWSQEGLVHPEVLSAQGAVGPDGRLYLALLEEGTTSRVVDIVLVSGVDSYSLANASVGEVTVPESEHGVRLVGDENVLWAVWRNKQEGLPASFRFRRVYPGGSPAVISAFPASDSSPTFDVAMGADGWPRVAYIDTSGREVVVARRASSGTWEKTSASSHSVASGKEFRDIALTSEGGQLGLFEVSGGGAEGIFVSTLSHAVATEPADWNNLAFGSPELLENDFVVAADDEIARQLDADWVSGHRAIVYTRPGSAEYVLSIRTGPGSWTPHVFASRTLVGEGASMAIGPDGGIHVAWPEADVEFPSLQHRLWSGSAFGPISFMNYGGHLGAGLSADPSGIPWASSLTGAGSFAVSTYLDPFDEDRDGVGYLLEKAFRMDPLVPDREQLPIFEVQEAGGERYLSITYLGDNGGSGDNPFVTEFYSYYAEVSKDLRNWSVLPGDVALESRFSISGRGTVNVYRSTTPIGAADREFLRIRVERN